MRTILRAMLAFALLLGSGVVDWAPVPPQIGAPVQESCCCGTPAGAEDSCPCPRPEGNQTPSQSLCQTRPGAVALVALRRTQAERRAESRPEPAQWAKVPETRIVPGNDDATPGREPDLGRHLARLGTLRI